MHSHTYSLAVSHLTPLHYWLKRSVRARVCARHKGCSHFQDDSTPLFWNMVPVAAIFFPVSSDVGCDPWRCGCLSSHSFSSMQCAWRMRAHLRNRQLWMSYRAQNEMKSMRSLSHAPTRLACYTHTHARTHTCKRLKQIKLLHSTYTSSVL